MMKLTVSDYTKFLLYDNPTQKKRMIGKFIIDDELSNDTWRVFSAHHKRSEKQVIIKQVHPVFSSKDKKSKKFTKEATTLSKLHHPHIAQLYSVARMSHIAIMLIEDGGENNVLKYVQEQGKLDEEEARRLFCQMVSAVSCIHKADIVHRNLVPENFCLDENNNVKVVGFGLSCKVNDENKICTRITYDIWELGRVLNFMLTGQLTNKSVNYLRCDSKHVIPESFGKEVGDLLSTIFNTKSREKLTIQGIIDHPWVKQSFTELPAGYESDYPKLFVDTNQTDWEKGIESDYILEKRDQNSQIMHIQSHNICLDNLRGEPPAPKKALVQLARDVTTKRQENKASKFKHMLARIKQAFSRKTAKKQ